MYTLGVKRADQVFCWPGKGGPCDSCLKTDMMSFVRPTWRVGLEAEPPTSTSSVSREGSGSAYALSVEGEAR